MALYLLLVSLVNCTVSSTGAHAEKISGIQIYVANPKPVPSQKQRDDATLAFARVDKNDFDGACMLFDRCLDLSNWTYFGAVQAARTYTRAGQVQKSMQLLDQIIKKDKTTPSPDRGSIALAWRYKGDCATDMNKLDEAVQYYLISANMVDNVAMKILAMRPASRIRKKQKRYAEALDMLNKAAPTGSEDLYWHHERGAILTEMKRPKEALEDLNFVIREVQKRRKINTDQNSVLFREALNARIECYNQLKQPALAMADRTTLKDLNQSWDEDLFGNAPIK